MKPELILSKKGFGLMELVIAVVLLGILAAISLPGTPAMQRKFKSREAKEGLRSILAYMNTDRSKTGVYNKTIDGDDIVVGPVVGNVPGINANGLLGNYFQDSDYTITAVGEDGFTARAIGTKPEVLGVTITMNESGATTESGY